MRLCGTLQAMTPYIKRIEVDNVRNLHDVKIDVVDNSNPQDGPVHLLLTGRNGVGKTTLLHAIWNRLRNSIYLGKYRSIRELIQDGAVVKVRYHDDGWPDEYRNQRGAIFAFFDAHRNIDYVQPVSPKALKTLKNQTEDSTQNLLQYLLNLKFRQAYAKSEGRSQEAAEIETWFRNFEHVLSLIFNDDQLKLDFSLFDYKFTVISKGVQSPLNHLADGYASMLHIISDLILKMQDDSQLVHEYTLPGVVFIDELELHLHLELQAKALQILTAIFPKIQFIIATHSPFVLSSIGNALAYDIGTQSRIDNADDYSYNSLAKGFFGVNEQSIHINTKLERLRRLVAQKHCKKSEIQELEDIMRELESISEDANHTMLKELRQLKLKALKSNKLSI